MLVNILYLTKMRFYSLSGIENYFILKWEHLKMKKSGNFKDYFNFIHMKKVLLLLAALIPLVLSSQETGKRAFLNDDGTLSVEDILLPEGIAQSGKEQNFDVLWQSGFPANPTFKNTRGVTLADLDNDGIEEILYGINNTLYAFKGNGDILWQKQVSGTIILPPTAVDLDGDGSIEIVLNTGGVPAAGRVYLLDNEGNDLPGWPLNFNNSWMINAPTVADLDGDGIMEIISGQRVSSTVGLVHALKMDGSPINENWPVEINATPAFTPSVADMNGDGEMNIVIAASQGTMYVFDVNGDILPGFPSTNPNISYSYQSPILADLNGDGNLSIIGSNHGDQPGFYVMENDGSYREGWPVLLDGWTYSPATVLNENDDFQIFMSDRIISINQEPLPTIYGFNPDGTNLPNYPIDVYGGTEGVLTIADINDDGILDIIFPSTITDNDGYGYIHAFSIDGSGELEGFPLRPYGFSYMNGAVLGDVDGDGLLDLTANTYTLFHSSGIDSTFVNVYNLNVPYNPESIKRNGYKGDNTRRGFVGREGTVGIDHYGKTEFFIYPNPSDGRLEVQLPVNSSSLEVKVFDLQGKILYSEVKTQLTPTLSLDLHHLNSGVYIIRITDGNKSFTGKWLKK